MKEKDARETALIILHRTLEEKGYSNILLDHGISGSDFGSADRALITQLVYGVLENKIYLDWIIKRFSRIPEKRIDPWVRNILRLSVFQIAFLDRIPGFAAVNEGVKLAKKYGGKSSAGFVNGILRNIIRNPDRLKLPPREKDIEEFISLKYSHPAWMVEDWIEIFGGVFTEDLCRSNNVKPEMVLRANTLRVNRDRLIDLLRQEGHNARPGSYSRNSVVVDDGFIPGESRAFKDGMFYVQDESSMLAVEVLNPLGEQLVIDVCSAPGGKCSYSAQLMENHGKVIARDINEKKLGMVRENCERLGAGIVETQVFDAERLDGELVGKADRVMVDAPCSGLGIIRRKPDIKWKKEREHYGSLRAIQQKILETSAMYLKPGGELVYSTCTVMPQENIQVVGDFVTKNKGFEFADISRYLPENMCTETGRKGYIQLFPNIHGTDGFFISKIRRVK